MGNFQHTGNEAESLKKVLETASAFSVPHGIDRKQAWEIFEKCIEKHNPRSRSVSIDFRIYFKIAASLLLIVVAGCMLYAFHETGIHTARGEFKTIVLPDHSTVMLNAGSFLQYNAIAFYFTRKVEFSGEGFFDVQKGSAFEVASTNGSTQVLGTQFNVLSRRNRYEVSCVEGKVRVSNSDRTTNLILTAKLQTRSVGKKLVTPEIFHPEVTAWQKGEFYFDNAPLADVLSTLELQYNVNISFKGDTSRRYSGYFTNKNLEEALKLVCLPLQLKYSIIKDQIKISTNN